jgi:hypothetical protein
MFKFFVSSSLFPLLVDICMTSFAALDTSKEGAADPIINSSFFRLLIKKT